MNGELSKIRLHAMRFVYLGTGVVVGTNAWWTLLTRSTPWDPLPGVAFSFWAAYATLMLLGVRFPLRMLPLILLQLFYKLTWLIAVAYPLWSAGALSPGTLAMIRGFAIAVLVDLVVIPWPYVFEKYLKAIFKPSAVAPPFRPLLAKGGRCDKGVSHAT